MSISVNYSFKDIENIVPIVVLGKADFNFSSFRPIDDADEDI